MSTYTRGGLSEIGGGRTVRRGPIRVGAFSVVIALVLASFISQAAGALAAQSLASAGALAAAAVSQSSAPTVKRGARPTKSIQVGRTPLSRSAAASMQVPNVAAHHSDVLANFDGVGSRDSAITNFGAQFEPPDQGLCVGNGFVVEMVNSAFRVYDTHGKTLAGPTNVNAPFHEGFDQFTSDPRCQYDVATNTWFAIVLFLNSTFTASTIDVAVNTSGDPTTDWTVFRIDTTREDAPASFGCPCFGDQPTLGIDASNIYTTTNEFSILGPQFNGAQIYAISKHDLVTHAANVHFVHYKDLTIGGALAGSVQPALTNGPASAEYFLSSLDPNGTGDNRIGVWALTNVGKVTTGGKPKLSSLVINSEAYAIPPAAAQKGSTSLINPDDDRMQQTQFINGEIWGALDTQVLPAGDSMPRAGVAWFRVKPHLKGSRLESAALTGQGYVLSEGQYLLYPAIQADGHGHAAIVFTLTSEDRFPSAAYAVLSDRGTAFGHATTAARGTGPYDPAAGRWGDYSWIVLDPYSDSVWMATEYMGPTSSQTVDGLRNWGTRVIHLSFE